MRFAGRTRALLLASLCALGVSVFAGGGEASAREQSVEGWIRQLREGDAAERIEALEELSLRGESARKALEAALVDLDPDLRFHALYLLRAPEGALERTLRRIAYGRAHQPGASYPASLKAYRGLMGRASAGTRSQLLRISLRVAPKGESQTRLLIVALNVWSEQARGKEVGPGEAQLLAELLGLDLGKASGDLVEAFAALPAAQRLAALRGALASTNTKILARAARVIGETTEPGQAVEARQLLLSLLDHDETRVRHQAIYALGLLGRGGEATRLRVIKAIRDVNGGVAAEALRLVGEWDLSLARGAVEAVAADVNRPAKTRGEAIRTLGLLGQPSSARVLRDLSRTKGALGALSTWALACLQAPGVADLERRIQTDDGADNPIYFRALARLGEEGRKVLRGYVLPKEPLPTGRARARLALQAKHALNAYASLDAPGAVDDLEAVIRRRVSALRQSDRVERLRAAEALALRTDPKAQRLVVELLLRPARVRAESELLRGVIRHGAPADLSEELSRVLQAAVPRSRKTLYAQALVRVDPASARRVLYPMIRAQIGDRNRHDLSHSLARAGDPSLLLKDAYPFARRMLEAARDERGRLVWLILGGLDQFYAGNIDEGRLGLLRVHWTRPHWHHDVAAYDLACVAAAEQKFTDALRLLRRAVLHGYEEPELARYDLDFVPLRKDPRFERLIGQLELAVETGFPPPLLPLP